MERRTFVKLMGAGGVAVLLPSSFVDCGDRQLEALSPWERPPNSSGDIRLELISYAILSPNAHNKQPWLVDLRGEGIDLYVDPTRLLPRTDPPARQITISQGTFIETLSIAASHHGMRAGVTLFPNGVDSLEQIGRNPVAHIALTKENGAREDELFSFIRTRHTNRRVYEGSALTGAELEALSQSCNDEQYPLRIITDTKEISTVAGMMTEAMRIETYNRSMHEETVTMLRFDDDEVEKHRDGMSFPNLGLSGMKLFFAKTFSSRSSAFDDSFLQRTVESIKNGAFSARAIGLISSRDTSRVDEVNVGRHFTRLFLTATKLGISLQPMSQVLEIDTIKSEFVKILMLNSQEPQMLFRLGRSTPTLHSPRRALQDFLKS